MTDIEKLERMLMADRDESVGAIEHSVRLGLPVPMEDVRVAAVAQFALDQITLDRLSGRQGLTPELLHRLDDHIAQHRMHTVAMKKHAEKLG